MKDSGNMDAEEQEKGSLEGEEKDAELALKEQELETALRRLEAVEAELKIESGARATFEREAADWGRQVVMLQDQLKEAATLLEETAAPDRLQTHLAQQQLKKQVHELKAGVLDLSSKCEQLTHEKEQLAKDHAKKEQKLREQLDFNFGSQLRNITAQWKLQAERQEDEFKKQLKAKDDEMFGLKEDNTSLGNVVHSLRQQLKHNCHEKTEATEAQSIKEEMESLREAHHKANLELSSLRSKQAILREENCALYAKVEDLESCEEMLRHVQARAKVLESECLELQTEKQEAENEAEMLLTRWRCSEQEALRYKRLYSRSLARPNNTILEEPLEETVKEEALFKVENEVDAAEKGASSCLRIEEMPSGQGAALSLVQQCEQLRSELRSAQATVAGLTTQLENERLRSRSVADDKTRLLVQNKELSEKISQLQRATASMARSKVLMNQYELKIGTLENERSHLQKALAQLETQLDKAQTSHSDLEQLAKNAVILRHYNEHLKHTENMLRWRVQKSEEQVNALEAGLLSLGERLEESAAQVASAWNEANEQQEAAALLGQQLATSQLQAAHLERRVRQLEEQEAQDNPLKELVDELASEVDALKSTLRSHRQQVAALEAPVVLQHRFATASLLQKLNQLRDDVSDAQREDGSESEWAIRLQEQLGEMIVELEQQKQRKSGSPQSVDGAATADAETEGHVAELLHLKMHLRLAERKCQDLEVEKASLEAELQNLETCLEQKELLREDQQSRLQLELQHKDLLIRKCQLEALFKQVELLICRKGPTVMEEVEGCCPGHLEEVGAALEVVHSQAVARLRHELANSDERPLNHDDSNSNDGPVRQTHFAQLESVEEKMASEERNLRHKLKTMLIDIIKTSIPDSEKETTEKGDWQQSEKAESALHVLKQLEESWGRQAEASRAAYLSQAAALAAESQSQQHQQLPNFILDNEAVKSKEGEVAEQKLECLLKEDKERHNKALLSKLENSVVSQFNKYLKEMWHTWKEKNLAEMLEQKTGDESSDVLKRVELAATELGRCYQAEVDKLLSTVSNVNTDVTLAQELEQLRNEKAQEQLRHQLELNELRTYFEQRCAKINQSYTEAILSQTHSRCSTDANKSLDMCIEPDATKMCETFSEPPSLRQVAEIAVQRRQFFASQEIHEQLQMDWSVSAVALDMTHSTRASLAPSDIPPFLQDDSIRHLEIDMEEEVARRVAEQTKHLQPTVDNIVQDLKTQFQEQMEALQEQSRQTVEESARQREQLIKELELRLAKETEKLKEKHARELQDLETGLEKDYHDRLDMALREMNNKLSQELEGLEALLKSAHAKELLKLQQTIEKQEVLLESEQDQMQALLEQERSKTLAALGDQLQALLVEGGDKQAAWPPELNQLKQLLATEANSSEQHLRQDLLRLQQELKSVVEDFQQQKQSLDTENGLLKGCVTELVRYLSDVDSHLNSIVEAAPVDSDTTSTSSVEDQKRRLVHLAPDLSTLSSALERASLDSSAVERMRNELDSCLARLRSEVADIIGVSEASLVGNKQVEELQGLLMASEAKIKDLEARLAQQEDVTQAVGAEGPRLGLEIRLQRLAVLHDKARASLQDNVPLETVLQELCAEGQHLADEARQEKDDLLMQIESADKKVRAHRAFMDEQAVEREQERDEFSRQLEQLKELLKEKERDRHKSAVLTKEVEKLESQVREQSQALQQAEANAALMAAQLKAANDKCDQQRKLCSDDIIEAQTQLKDLVQSLHRRTKILMQKNARINEDEFDEGGQAAEVSIQKWVRRLQAQVEKYEKAEQAALAKLQMEVKVLRRSEEELQVEREELQRRVESQLEQISGLQSSIDQQRIQQISARELTTATVRHAQIRSAEQLGNAKETIAAKEKEVKELRAQLEKSKRALVDLEAESARRDLEAAEEIDRLRERLEAAESESAHLSNISLRRSSGSEHPVHLALLTERLDNVRDALLASDVSRDKLLDMMEEVREETRSHSMVLLRSASRNQDPDLFQSSMRAEALLNSTFGEINAPATPKPLDIELDEEPTRLVETSNKEKEEQLQKELLELAQKYEVLKEENVQLQKAVADASAHFEQYAQQIQAEIAASQAPELLDISIASENLQRLLARVQDGGVEVLSLSELAVLRRAAQETTNSSTQTIRSALTEATIVADLKLQMQQMQMETTQREQLLQQRIESSEDQVTALEAALSEERMRIAEEAAVSQQLRLEVERERCRACALDSALSTEQLNVMVLRTQLEGEAVRHRATLSALEDLRNARLGSPPVLPVGTSIGIATSPLCCQREEELEHQFQREREQQLQREHDLEFTASTEARNRRRLEAERSSLEEVIKQLKEEKHLLQRQLESRSGNEQWALERAKLLAEVERLRHEAVTATATLSAERADALLERMRLQYHTPAPHHSATDDVYDLQTKVALLNGRCSQLESWRKNLCWQKRYLQLALRAYEASQEQLRKALRRPPTRTPPIRSFKGLALLVVAFMRMAILMKRRVREQRAHFLIRSLPPSPERCLNPRAPAVPSLIWNNSTEVEDDASSTNGDEFCKRSDLIQQRLGLNRKF